MKKHLSGIEDKVVYQSKNGALELKADIQQDTIWANLTQISQLFNTDKSGVSRHIKIYIKQTNYPKRELLQNSQQFRKKVVGK